MEITIDDVVFSKYDITVVADGSGSDIMRPCGWCYTIIANGKVRKTITGGAGNGTCGAAELFPFCHFLWHLTSLYGSVQENTIPPLKLAFVSDNQTIVRCGRREYARSKNGGLWASIDWYEQYFAIDWFWIPRCSTEIHKNCDRLANVARVALEPSNFSRGEKSPVLLDSTQPPTKV